MPETGEGVGRVVRSQSGFYTILAEDGTSCVAVLRGRIKRDRREAGLVALGDLVRYQPLDQPEGDAGHVSAVITEILPRRSALARRAPGPKGVWSQDIVVANVDQLVVVIAARSPEPRLRLLDRFLAVGEMDEIDCTIVLNKVDLGVADDLRAAMERYRDIGYPVILASAVTREGVDAISEALQGRLSAVVGPSGVGKSSLLNAIDPSLDLRVAEVGGGAGKGRHTTRVGELLPLAGGLVADTPGLRELGVWEVDPGLLEFAFVEFRPFVHSCRYYDCTHVHEPGCAVRAAVERGEIHPERHESYVKLLADEA